MYETTLTGTFSKDYGLKDQVNRTTGSVMDNIAEGFGRNGNKEFINFLLISRASVLEVQSQLLRALDRNHIDPQQFEILFDRSEEVISIVTGFVIYLKNSERKGLRYE